MPTYTVQDEQSGKTVTFEWTGDAEPTDTDMAEVFAQASGAEAATQSQPPLSPPLAGRDAGGFAETLSAEAPAVKQIASDIYHPTLETAGMAVGAPLGAAAGAAAGPPGVVLGGVAGGAGGYAVGKGVADTFDILLGLKKPAASVGETFLQSGKDVAEGALYAGGGEIAGQLLKPVIQQGGKVLLQRVVGAATGAAAGGYAGGSEGAAAGAVAGTVFGPHAFKLYRGITPAGAKETAHKGLVAVLGDGSAIYAGNAKEAKALEEAVNATVGKDGPRLKFDMAQQTNDPGVITLLRKAVRGGDSNTARLFKERAAENTAAIQRYYSDMFPESEGIADVMDAVRARQASLAQAAQGAEAAAMGKAADIPTAGPEATGQRALGALQTARTEAKNTARGLYNEVPENMEIDANGMLSKFKEINTPKYVGEADKNFPDTIQRVQVAMGRQAQKNAVAEMVNGVDPIPTFANDEEAVRFGVRATKGQVEELKRLMNVHKARSAAITAQAKGAGTADIQKFTQLANESSAEATQSARYRQAIEGSQGIHPQQKLGNVPMPTEVNQMRLKDAMGIRSALLEEARAASKGITPNPTLAARLYQSADAVSDAISAAEGDTGAAALLKRANQFYKENVVPFRQGGLGDIMAKGANGEVSKVPMAQIPGRIWGKGQLSTATQFIDAIGFDNARAIMKDHAAYDMLQSATDSAGLLSTPKLNSWKASNRPTLRKFGLENTFDDVIAAQQIADDMAKVKTQFESTVAARLLNMDPQTAIGTALGTKQTAKAMRELLDVTRGNEAATNGLRKAFGDYAARQMKTVSEEVTGTAKVSHQKLADLLKRYEPAAEILYAGKPQQLAALKTMQRAYQISVRNLSSPFGGGSDTAELLSKMSQLNILSRTATVARGVFGILRQHGDKMAQRYIDRALFNPEYAQTLIEGTRGRMDPRDIKTIINRQMSNLLEQEARTAGQGISAGAAIADTEQRGD